MKHTPLRARLLANRNSWSAGFRARRAAWFVETFPDLSEMAVLDLGGHADTWIGMPVRPRRVDVINLDRSLSRKVSDWLTVQRGNACALPSSIADRRYDLVYSNSVLEHVGGHERRLRFAETVHRMADAHWVQTPYRYFPMEPHWVVPGMQLMPVRVRAMLAQRSPLAFARASDREDAVRRVLWTELLDKTQMRHYFPDSRLRVERVAGLVKSLIAVKTE